MHFREDGHRVTTAADGAKALAVTMAEQLQPDVILTDYNLPGGVDGVLVAEKLRTLLGRDVAVIILTGDISTQALSTIASKDWLKLDKPVKLDELDRAVQCLLPKAAGITLTQQSAIVLGVPIVHIVDDDPIICTQLRELLEADGHSVQHYNSCEAFLGAYHPGSEGCLLVDGYLPGMNGLTLIQQLANTGHRLPTIMITGSSDVALAVAVMKAGASNFIEKPISSDELLASVARALEQSRDSGIRDAAHAEAIEHISNLTTRQREVMTLVLAGHPSKNIAMDLGISQRTVENHRSAIMKKTGSKSLPELARLIVTAEEPD